MSDQSTNDELKVGFNEPIYGKNGLLMDTKGMGANDKGIPEPKLEI